jgi:RNase P/RNase MRP subunit POP5
MYYLLTWLRYFSAKVHKVSRVGASLVTYVNAFKKTLIIRLDKLLGTVKAITRSFVALR